MEKSSPTLFNRLESYGIPNKQVYAKHEYLGPTGSNFVGGIGSGGSLRAIGEALRQNHTFLSC